MKLELLLERSLRLQDMEDLLKQIPLQQNIKIGLCRPGSWILLMALAESAAERVIILARAKC